MLPENDHTMSFDTRMRRAVQQQENRSLQPSLTSSSPSSKNKKKRPFSSSRGGGPIPVGKIILVLSPVVLVILLLVARRTYNSWVDNDREIDLLIANEERSVLEEEAKEVQEEEARRRRQYQLEVLVLTTKYGTIRIRLRPDLSEGSVDYLHRMLATDEVCHVCNLYRAERPGILQGIIKHTDVPINDVRGPCPDDGGVSAAVPNDCPEWDAHCGCHGPVMTRGSVAWAAGEAGGPDFFIDNYPTPADWWGTQHTNFGKIVDKGSFDVIDRIFELPIHEREGLSFLEEPIHFDMSLEVEEV